MKTISWVLGIEVSLAVLLLQAACGQDDGEVKAPFEPPSRTTVFSVDGRMPTGSPGP